MKSETLGHSPFLLLEKMKEKTGPILEAYRAIEDLFQELNIYIKVPNIENLGIKLFLINIEVATMP